MAGGGSKKNGMTSSENKSFNHGDIVLARLKGYPPWPGRITNADEAPSGVMASRPGKSPHIYCVQFFPAGDFSWLNSREINPLSTEEIDTYISTPHRKATGGLMEGYQTAKDPTEWDAKQAEFRRLREEAVANEPVDELEDEDAGAAGAKRKRPAADKSKSKKKSKGPKKSVTAIESEDEAGPAKPKKSATASKPAPTMPAADDDPQASDPESVKVKDWRHKLQRAFLGKGLPEPEEMPDYHKIFQTIEEYKDMTIEALQYSKIGKVMKKIAVLNGIPRNDEFSITDRASKLMVEWQNFIESKGASVNGHGTTNGGDSPAAPKTESAPAPVSAEPERPAPAASEPAPPADVSAPAPEPDIESAPAAAPEPEEPAESKMEVDAPVPSKEEPQSAPPAAQEPPVAAPAESEKPTLVEPVTLPTPIYPAVNGQ